MPPRTIVVNPTAPGPSLSFVMPAGVDLSVESMFAAIDASAAGDVTAMLEVADSSGQVIARKRQGEVVSAGTNPGSATWALRLDDKSASSAGLSVAYFLGIGQNTGLLGHVQRWALQYTTDAANYSVDPLNNQHIIVQETGQYQIIVRLTLSSGAVKVIAANVRTSVTEVTSGNLAGEATMLLKAHNTNEFPGSPQEIQQLVTLWSQTGAPGPYTFQTFLSPNEVNVFPAAEWFQIVKVS